MKETITLSADNTLKFLVGSVEAASSYTGCVARAIITSGYYDYRETIPESYKFVISTEKDVGLGIGSAKIEVELSEEEAASLIVKRLNEQGIEAEKVTFKQKAKSYGRSEMNKDEFDGATIALKTLNQSLRQGKYLGLV